MANSLWWLVAIIVAANLARKAAPSFKPNLGMVLIQLIAFYEIWLFGSFLISAGFFYGLIRCPSCDARFAPRFPPGWVLRTCQHCHFDIYTQRHAQQDHGCPMQSAAVVRFREPRFLLSRPGRRSTACRVRIVCGRHSCRCDECGLPQVRCGVSLRGRQR